MIRKEAGAPFDRQLVERQVFAGEGQRVLEFGRPGLGRLAGPGIDQVEGVAREMAARGIESGQRLVRRMLAAEELERSGIERLHAQGHAIDARFGQGREPGGLDRGRVGFQGDLDLRRAIPQRLGAGDHGIHGLGRHQRRRAAAEEDRFDPAAWRLASGVLELCQQRFAPASLFDAVADMTVEVAIGALRLAERPMDVDAQRRRVHPKQASTIIRKARPRWLMAFFSPSAISAVVRVPPAGWKQGS